MSSVPNRTHRVNRVTAPSGKVYIYTDCNWHLEQGPDGRFYRMVDRRHVNVAGKKQSPTCARCVKKIPKQLEWCQVYKLLFKVRFVVSRSASSREPCRTTKRPFDKLRANGNAIPFATRA